MLSSSEIKFLKSLSRKREREANSLFVVEGEKLVAEAINSGYEIERVLYASEIGEDAMARITLLSSPSPAYAVVRMKSIEENITIMPDKLYLMLDSVRDPGNMGTILRIADWFGAEAIIASEECVELYNPKVIQASMGAIFRTRVQYCDLMQYLANNRGKTTVYGTYPDGPVIYTQNLTKGGIIVMGSESEGISGKLEEFIDTKLSVPPFRKGSGEHPESLNVAIASALICSEFRRSSV
jgi:TrmH family RNA methyltransferase